MAWAWMTSCSRWQRLSHLMAAQLTRSCSGNYFVPRATQSKESRPLRLIDTTLQDLRFAIRMFRKNPGFTVIAVATIALGIGSNTAVFSVVHSVLLKQLPYAAPDRLVTLSEKDVSAPGMDQISFGSARAYREQSRMIENLMQYNDGGGGRLLDDGGAQMLRGQRVSANFFSTLGVRAQLGRVFVSDDALPGRNDVIILSHGLWTRLFGGNPRVVGSCCR